MLMMPPESLTGPGLTVVGAYFLRGKIHSKYGINFMLHYSRVLSVYSTHTAKCPVDQTLLGCQ